MAMKSIRNEEDLLLENLFSELPVGEAKAGVIRHEVSKQIILQRLNRGMTQKSFADFLGVTQGMVSKWESGDYNFTINSLAAIFEKLSVGFDLHIETEYENAVRTEKWTLSDDVSVSEVNVELLGGAA